MRAATWNNERSSECCNLCQIRMMEKRTLEQEQSVEPKIINLRASMTPGASMDHFMHSNNGGKNLPFAVVTSSGQDEDYPASELNKGIQGRGWQSSRFCFYPQELILELQWPSRIINMQLLCHEYKIPSKVEVFVSLTTPWINNEKAVNQMKRLGYLSLDPNERSGHQARELKSIHVDAPAAVLRLVLHNCYNNKLNSYNQVGLVALIITGEPLDEHQLSEIRQRGYSPLLQTPRIQQVSCSKVVDATLHSVDSFTADRIHKLQKEKLLAVQEEDYDEAKRLKNLIERLKGLGEQIKQLELRKRAAVEMEDYDAAKSCKMEIERLRQCDGTGQESLSHMSKNPDSSSKQSKASASDNNYHKETFKDVNYQAVIMKSTTKNHEDKHSEHVEDNKNSIGLDVHARTASDPLRVSTNPSLTNQPGEKRQGVLSTVFPWWKGKEVLRSSDEDLKTTVLHVPPREYYASTNQQKQTTLQDHVEHYASTSQHKLTTLDPPHVDQYASTSQQKTINPDPTDVEQYPCTNKQTTSTHFPVEQNGGKPDEQIAMIHPHVEKITQNNASIQPSKKVGNSSQPSASKLLPLDHSIEGGHENTTMDSPTEDLHKIDRQQLFIDHFVKSELGVSGAEPKATVPQYSFCGSVPSQNGSHATHEQDTSVPEPLTDVLRAEVGPLLNILDLYYVECLCSKQWQLRDKALQHIVKLLQSRTLIGDPSANLKLLDLIVLRAINDRVPNIYYGSLQLLKEYVIKYSGEVPPREIQHGVAAFVSILLDKLGESNVRIRDAASETLTFLASKREIGLHMVAHHMLKSPKTQATWRPVLGRLQWLLAAIPMFGVQPNSKTGFISETLMSFVHQAFNSPNGEVRNTAVKVTTEVYKLIGATVERYLKGIKPIIREVLLNNFQKFALDTRTLDDSNPLTYEELDNIPIIRRSQKATSMTYSEADCRPIEASIVKKLSRDTGLHSMVVDQQERLSNGHDDQHMYSNQATAPIVNSSCSEEGSTEEVVLTTLCASDQSPRLDPNIEVSYAFQIDTIEVNDEIQMVAEKDNWADQCLFCGKQDPSFLNGDTLDLHFCQKCPMLVGCGNCKQIVEIATLKEHYLYECTSGRRYVECLKCSQAIPEVRLTSHLRSKECRHGKHHKSSRCPLCHHTVQSGDAGWREHLLKPPGCSKNPRTKMRN